MFLRPALGYLEAVVIYNCGTLNAMSGLLSGGIERVNIAGVKKLDEMWLTSCPEYAHSTDHELVARVKAGPTI